jgi:hypothetical protein
LLFLESFDGFLLCVDRVDQQTLLQWPDSTIDQNAKPRHAEADAVQKIAPMVNRYQMYEGRE